MNPDGGRSSSASPPPSASLGEGAETKEEERCGKQVVVVLVGPPGSGKSTFAEAVVAGSNAGRPWVRVCQDTIGNGKAGTKIQCLKAASDALKEGKSVLIDRCNLEREQRADFVKLGSTLHADVHAIALDLPAKVCISRAVSRKGHEGNLQGGKAALVVNRMLQKKETPLLTEGFSRIMSCNDDGDIKKAVDLYSSLGLSDSLPSGTSGQKSKGPVQVGIMKFLKKGDTSSGPKITLSDSKAGQQNPLPKHEKVEARSTCSMEVEKGLNDKKENEDHAKESDSDYVGSRTLAFPSISTADFQFDLDRASDIIVDTAADFLQKFDDLRLVLVDLSEKSRILSLVKEKASKKSIDGNRFFTFVGDITQLHTRGGLQCSVIANAANWRLKPGGGGVNAAIFNAAGESLQHATKKCADALRPGTSVAAKRHVLVVSRTDGLDSLANVKTEHLPLLRRMHSAGVNWAQKFLGEDPSLVFRLGYHSVPSMRQLHLHIISQDFNSTSLKNKKHWNSFSTPFFLDSVDVIEEIEQHGSATTSSDEKVLAMELRCHRCRSAHPNIPKLKSHIASCKSSFPSHLQKNRLLSSSTMHIDCT
nr:unnamed protein product [Digitaria exilis]